MQKPQNTKMRPGYSLIELILALAIIAIMIGIVYSIFSKTNKPAQADRWASKIEAVQAAIERSKSYNSDTYFVYSGPIRSNVNLRNTLGGNVATKDIAGWTYNCSRGADTTVSFTTSAFDDSEVQALTQQKVASQIAPWTVRRTGTKLQISKPHSVCQ
jgi:prepilin-type N-terminal cleavage/methylation domain-containing protein